MTTDPEAQRVTHMLKQCKTRADVEELVRMLDRRNMRLQRVRNGLAHQLATIRQETSR